MLMAPGGLAHRGAGGDDDEFGVLQAGGHAVELGIVGGEARNLAALLVELVDGAEGRSHNVGDVGEAAGDGLVGYFDQTHLDLRQHVMASSD